MEKTDGLNKLEVGRKLFAHLLCSATMVVAEVWKMPIPVLR